MAAVDLGIQKQETRVCMMISEGFTEEVRCRAAGNVLMVRMSSDPQHSYKSQMWSVCAYKSSAGVQGGWG